MLYVPCDIVAFLCGNTTSFCQWRVANITELSQQLPYGFSLHWEDSECCQAGF